MSRLIITVTAFILLVSAVRPAAAQELTLPPDAQRVVEALFAGDSDAVRNLIQFDQVPCTHEQIGIGPPPLCGKDDAEGAPVDAFPAAVCEGWYVQPSGLNDLAASLAAPGPTLYGVFVNPTEDRGFFYGDFVALYDGLATIGLGAVWIDNGRVAGLHTGCITSGPKYVESWGLGPEVAVATETPGPSATVPALPATGTSSSGSGAGPTRLLALSALGLVSLFSFAIVRLLHRRAAP